MVWRDRDGNLRWTRSGLFGLLGFSRHLGPHNLRTALFWDAFANIVGCALYLKVTGIFSLLCRETRDLRQTDRLNQSLVEGAGFVACLLLWGVVQALAKRTGEPIPTDPADLPKYYERSTLPYGRYLILAFILWCFLQAAWVVALHSLRLRP